MNKLKRAISAALSFAIMLTMSGSHSEKENVVQDSPVIDEESDKQVKIITLDENRKELEQDFNNYKQYLEDYKIDYNLEVFYPSIEDITFFRENEANTFCKTRMSKNPEVILRKIKESTEDYVKEHPDYISLFSSSHGYAAIIEEALTSIINDLVTHATNDVNEDLHRLQSMVLVFDDELMFLENGQYQFQNNMAVIHKGVLDGIDDKEELEDSIYKILKRTVNFARLNPCDCRIEQAHSQEKYVGPLLSKTTTSSIFTEGAVESEMYNLQHDFTFDNETSYNTRDYRYRMDNEAILMLLALFNPNANLEDYYSAVFDNDLEKIYQFFDLKTEADYDEDVVAKILELESSYKTFLSKYYDVSVEEIIQMEASEQFEEYLATLRRLASDMDISYDIILRKQANGLFKRFPLLRNILAVDPSIVLNNKYGSYHKFEESLKLERVKGDENE